ncbi:Uncharacterised protein [Mycobacteroides abscessus subsp. abscessus]|uniref:hypothetical protein n=1 Tax=Mycobacteroides abscessus TaxID=36809 RepID=UPI0009D29BF0|nr:hypothetical protein [Mycobacteroides abscessus]SKR40624.1 Uncharacterised protein [Mycobacteroides abscessus subsp. abscessus]
MNQNWCANPYIQEDIIQPECGMYSEWAACTISLWKRGETVGQITGDYIAAEWLAEEHAWGLWSACNMPAALVVLLGSGVIGHAASDTSSSMFVERVMDAVTDGLAHGPSVRVALDGAELRVELMLADTGMDVDAAEASCGWWTSEGGSG